MDPQKEKDAMKIVKKEDKQKLATDEIFIYPNIFIKMPLSLAKSLKTNAEAKLEMPLKKRETGCMSSGGSKRVKDDEKCSLDEPCRSIRVRTSRREWKFLAFVKKRANLKEYETSVWVCSHSQLAEFNLLLSYIVKTKLKLGNTHIFYNSLSFRFLKWTVFYNRTIKIYFETFLNS